MLVEEAHTYNLGTTEVERGRSLKSSRNEVCLLSSRPMRDSGEKERENKRRDRNAYTEMQTDIHTNS